MKFKIKLNNYVVAGICSLIFFVVEMITLNAYGTSWDETLHFSRGQVYLNYFLTGKKEYDQTNPRKSFYQLDYQNGDFFFKDVGHPPVNGTIAATFNYIFYQKLGLLSDIHSYQLFNILASSLLLFIVSIFALETLGLFGGVIAFVSLFTYPFFFSEAHFNVKDPAETAFFAATIWTFYKSLHKGSWRWLLLGAIFFSLGLGTKFNILFLPFIILPYLLFRYKDHLTKRFNIKIPSGWMVTFLLAPILVTVVFIASWPMLWSNTLTNIGSIFEYYKNIGTSTDYQPASFYILGFNTYPIQWILFTTPPIVLFLFVLGLISVFIKRNMKGSVTILWLFWFVVPIFRVVVPNASIYGGIRQIMEFLPAMVLITGLGAVQLLDWLTGSKLGRNNFAKWVVMIGIITLFIWPIFILVKMHPNQNVYFNSLIGGVKGAQQKNFPSWGNSYGNAYLQGVEWINKNAPLNSKVALIQGTETNTPKILFRSDIMLGNFYWSGLDREGEYLMDLTFNDTGKAFYYTWEYVDKFLNPVYQVTVDGVPILKIWKNDLEHTKYEYKVSDKLYLELLSLEEYNNNLIIKYPKEVVLSKLVLNFDLDNSCIMINDSIVETSRDGGLWVVEKDSIPFPQVRNKNNLDENILKIYFAAKRASFVKLKLNSQESCVFNNTKIDTYVFDNLLPDEQ